MIGDDLLGQHVLRVQGAQLDQQTFPQVACANSQRVKFLHDDQPFFDIVGRVFTVLGNFLERGGQVAVFVEVSNNGVGNLANDIRANRYAQLPLKMVGKSARRREELFKRRPLNDLALAGNLGAATGIKILVKKRGDIKFVEWIGCLGFRKLFGFGFDKSLVAVVLTDDPVFAQLFEYRVLHHFLVDHLAQFQTVQRQHADHLNKSRRKDLLLGNLEVEFESLPAHWLDQFRRKLSPR